MKINLFFFALLIGIKGYSQNYYSENYAKGTNVTFKCTTMFIDRRVISNVANKYVMTPQLLRNGSQAVPDSYRCIRSNDPNNEKLHSIIRAAFTPAEIARLKMANARLGFDAIIAPTGEIIEVGFLFPMNSKLASIKPDTYYQVEQKIKAQIRYTLDQKTRDLYPWIPEPLSVEFSDI